MKRVFKILLVILITVSCNDDDVNTIDYTEFDAALAEAVDTADITREGEANGDIIIGSTAILNAVIEQNAPYRDTAINQGTIDLATGRLRDAIDVYNASIVIIDGTSLITTIENAQSLHDNAVEGEFPGEYLVGSKAILQSAIDSAQVVADNVDATQNEIDEALTALLMAINEFNDAQIPPLDFTALNMAIDDAQELHDGAVEGTEIGQFEVGSKAIFQAAINEASTVASTTEGITQADLDEALADLLAAVVVFESGQVGGPERDTTELEATIASAQMLHDTAVEGSNPGEYPVGSKAILQAAIDDAQAVVDDLTQGQSAVDAANATLEDAVTVFVNSVNGISVLNLDGASHIETPSFQGISGGAMRTMEAWINTTASANNATLIMSWGVSEAQQKWDMRINQGRLRIEYSGGGINGTTTINDGTWHHVAVVLTVDGGNLQDNAQLYVDGVLENSSGNGTAPTNTSNLNNFNIGRSASQTERFFAGQISDVRIWSVARSASEIMSNKDSRLTGSETGLAGYWKLNDGLGTTVTDSGPSNHTGNFVGNPTWEIATSGLPFND